MGLDQNAYFVDLDNVIDEFHTNLNDDDHWGCDFWHWGKDYDIFDELKALEVQETEIMNKILH
jgi:hypothetical protein